MGAACQHEYSSLSQAFGDTVRRVQRRFDILIESAIAFPLPFRDDGLLIVLAGHAPDVVPVLAEAFAHAPRRSTVLCLRRPELFQLALPNVYAMDTLSLPCWMRDAGEVLFGMDLRPLVPIGRHDPPLLGNHLTAVTHYFRNHVILETMARRDYARLARAVDSQRAALMLTALLVQGIWRVYPDTVTEEFVQACPDAELRENVSEWTALRRRFETIGEGDAVRIAHRCVWLFELFVRGLWRQVT